MPTPEQAEARLRERLAAEHAAVYTIAARREEIDAERLEAIKQEQRDPERLSRMPLTGK